MKEDVIKHQQESDLKVTTGLENAKKIKAETSSENNTLMNGYLHNCHILEMEQLQILLYMTLLLLH